MKLFNKTKIHINADVDECTLNTDQCTQNCANTNGSYTCSCMSGYRLQADGKTCQSKTTFLLFSFRKG